MKTSIESNKKMKRTALIIVMILLMQVFAPLLNVYAVDIETSLGTVSLISGAKKITAGEEVELVITVTGNNIFAFNGYIDYDREVFETITNANVTELPAGWNVISDGTLDTAGVGFYIEMQNSTSAGVNNPTIKMKLRAKKTTEKTKITINYINKSDIHISTRIRNHLHFFIYYIMNVKKIDVQKPFLCILSHWIFIDRTPHSM